MAPPANPTPSTDVIAEMKAGFTEVKAKLAALGSSIDVLGYRIDAIRRLIWTLLALLTTAVLGLLYMVVTGS